MHREETVDVATICPLNVLERVRGNVLLVFELHQLHHVFASVLSTEKESCVRSAYCMLDACPQRLYRVEAT